LSLKIKDWKLINFIICGILSAGIYFATLALLIEGLNMGTLTSYSISYVVSSSFNFIYNKKITFMSNNFIVFELIKYLIMLGLSYTIGVAIIKIVTINLGVSIYISSFISIGFTTIFRYIISKNFVYK